MAVGIASTVMCGTIVSCGLAAAGLSAVDFGVASHDASMAFKEGVSQSATSRDGESLMTKADSAAGVQALSLVFGAPTALKSSFDLLRKGSALAARSSTEVVGRQVATKPGGATSLNALHSIVYRDLLKDHEGREREILEIVIERLQKRKMDPDQISKLLKERVRQCSK